MNFSFLFLILLIKLSFGCLDVERRALLNFKSLLTDPSNRLASWQGQNCCSWQGIRCSNSSHVIAVNLRNPNPESFMLNINSELVPTSNSTSSTAIKGTISPSLFTLKHLRYLDVSYNNFTSSKLPVGLSNLTHLAYLNLSNAMFSDSITSQLTNLTLLTWLDLSCSNIVVDLSTVSVRLTTSSPRVTYGSTSSYIYGGNLIASNLNWLQGLGNLKELRLSGIDLSQASRSIGWAEPISILSNLRSLDVSNCRISGRIPVGQLLNLTNLYSLKMDSNPLSSHMPDELVNLTTLSILDLTSSDLQGPLPYLPQLKRLYVGNNYGITIDLSSMFSVPWARLERLEIQSTQVIGSIPYSFSNTTMLVYFSADNCSIYGSLPSSLVNLSRLETIVLNTNNINGQLPQTISNLKTLRYLSLADNYIEGPIPYSICEIYSLQYLNLDINMLTGGLPECISQLPNLTRLYIQRNKLNGSIPISLFQKSNLKGISLGSNRLTVKFDKGSFPPNFNPEILELMSCNIGGGIPDFISNLTQLVVLILANNTLTGPIPSWLFNLPALSYLELSENNLQGALPPYIRLQRSSFWPTILSLADNKLQGSIPPHLENIEVINLAGNNFEGFIPEEIGGLVKIRYLSFSRNRLSGQIPRVFCQKANAFFMVFDLSHNSFSGSIPPSLGNCTSLIFLNLRGNKFGGVVPNELEDAKNLAYLDLGSNHFKGSFPSVIERLKFLEVLNLERNRFEGRLPQSIANLHDLRVLVLASNFFNESIPSEITKLEKLQYIGFSNNRFSGPIPSKLDGLKMMIFQPKTGIILGEVISFNFAGIQLDMAAKGSSRQLPVVYTFNTGIDLSLNNLTGRIPEKIGVLDKLYMLNLSHNHLSGEIPKSIGNLSTLQSLDLSFNCLSGDIPVALALLNFLAFLNLSYNNLSGKIPVAPHFDTLDGDGSTYIGNPFLCGFSGWMKCSIEVPTPTITTNEDDDDDSHQEKFLFYGVIAMGYAVGFWGLFLMLYLIKEKWRERYWGAIDKFVLRIIQCRERVSSFTFN